MARTPRTRHLTHGNFDRTDRSRRLRAFILDRADDLIGTGAAKVISASGFTLAQAAIGSLTAAGQVDPGNTVTVGDIVYTFDGDTDEPYSVTIGLDIDESLLNLQKAVNGTGTPGTEYSVGTIAHPDVTATANDIPACNFEAKVAGAAGNGIVTMSWGSNLEFGEATLTEGLDAVGTTNVTMTGHGLSGGEGPFLLTSTDTAPAGLVEGAFYWVVGVVNANTVKIATSPRSLPAQVFDAGVGTHTLTKSDADEAIYDYLKQNAPAVVRNATDVDNL